MKVRQRRVTSCHCWSYNSCADIRKRKYGERKILDPQIWHQIVQTKMLQVYRYIDSNAFEWQTAVLIVEWLQNGNRSWCCFLKEKTSNKRWKYANFFWKLPKSLILQCLSAESSPVTSDKKTKCPKMKNTKHFAFGDNFAHVGPWYGYEITCLVF